VFDRGMSLTQRLGPLMRKLCPDPRVILIGRRALHALGLGGASHELDFRDRLIVKFEIPSADQKWSTKTEHKNCRLSRVEKLHDFLFRL
jgi:hypothetical protein